MNLPEQAPIGPPPEIETTPKLEKYVPGYEQDETPVVLERRQAVETMFQGGESLPPNLLQELSQENFVVSGKQRQESGDVMRMIPDRYFTDETLKAETTNLISSIQEGKSVNELLEAAAVAGSTDKKRAGLEAFRVVGARLLQEHGITKERSWAQLSEDDKRVSRLAEAMILGAEAKAVQLAKREKNITPAAVKEYTDKFTRVLSRYPSNRADIAPTIHQRIRAATEGLPQNESATVEKTPEAVLGSTSTSDSEKISEAQGKAISKDGQPGIANNEVTSNSREIHYKNHWLAPRLNKVNELIEEYAGNMTRYPRQREQMLAQLEGYKEEKARIIRRVEYDLVNNGPITDEVKKAGDERFQRSGVPNLFDNPLIAFSSDPELEKLNAETQRQKKEEEGVEEEFENEKITSDDQADEEPPADSPPIEDNDLNEEEISPVVESDVDFSPLPDSELPETPDDFMRETTTAPGVVDAGTKSERGAGQETDAQASMKLVQGFKQISGQRSQKRMDELFNMVEITRITKEFSDIDQGLATSVLVAEQIMAGFEKQKKAINDDPDSLRALQKQLGKSRELFERMANNQDGSIDDLLRNIVARQKRIRPDKVREPDIHRLQRSFTRVQKVLSKRIEALEAYLNT